MIFVHVVMAVFASWRLTELVIADGIFSPVRNLFRRWPRMMTFLGCHRCVSVWTGLIATLVFLFYPFANWPFAMSMLFMMQNAIFLRVLK